MDMTGMMGGMMTMMLAGALLLALLIGAAVYLALRAGQRDGQQTPPARETLQQRLARGEIGPEEYYERESALRSSEHRASGSP